MREDLAAVRPAAGLAAVALTALAVGLAGCGSSGGHAAAANGASASSAPGASSSSVAALPTGSAHDASGGSAGASSPLAKSRLRVLTRLKKSQLCGLVGTAEASKMLGAPTAAPAYASRKGLGITCQWQKKGQDPAGTDELYVGISSIVSWTSAQQVDKLLHTRSVKVAGHPALAADPQGKIAWAQVDVALGGDDDPVAEYRAPTMTGALALATALTPRIVAMG